MVTCHWAFHMHHVRLTSGPGRREAGRSTRRHGTALVGNRHAQCGDWAAFSFFLAS